MFDSGLLAPKIQDVLLRLEGYFPQVISPDLTRIRALLGKMGRPDLRLPPILHVAGTNGKGSTCAFLQAMCEAAGLSVHVYTSPHLVKYNERIRLAGELISDAYLLECLLRTESALSGGEITFFEATTAAAFLAFSETPADVLILEVGLGGRLDATNIIPDSAVSIITPIGMDHEAFLGNTLAEIAGEKCGIIREGGKVVAYQDSPIVGAVIAEYCASHSAELHAVKSLDIDEIPKNLPLSGKHQRCNAALAAKALRVWRPELVTTDVLERGVSAVQWPARLQRLQKRPSVGTLTLGHLKAGVWLDGGHNPHAARIIAQFFADRPKPFTLICAMQSQKDVVGYFSELALLNPKILAIPNAGGRPYYPPVDMVQAAQSLGLEAEVQESLEAALAHLWALDAECLLVGGSLFLAGEMLAELGQYVK